MDKNVLSCNQAADCNDVQSWGLKYIFIETFFPQVFTREKIVGQVTREDKSLKNRKIFVLYYFYSYEISKEFLCIL